MGNFLAILSDSSRKEETDNLFRKGIVLARLLKGQAPGGSVSTDWSLAASFPRKNGTGSPVVSDPSTGSWLLTVGTWFQEDGLSEGDEPELLRKFLDIGGVRLAKTIDGFFVVVCGDGRSRETFVLTDPAGSCRCYLRRMADTVALSCSSAILAGLEESTPDLIGWQEYLSCNTLFEDRSLFREVRKLSAASVYRYSAGAVENHTTYWSVEGLEPESRDGQDAVDQLGDRLVGAARRIAHRYPRPVVDLTGGYDSRALVAAFMSAGVSFSTTVAGSSTDPDVVVSRRISIETGREHRVVSPPVSSTFARAMEAFAFTDGEFDPFEYSRIMHVHRELSLDFDISINGSFGGLARGLWWELLFPFIGHRKPIDSRKLATARYLPRNYDPALFPPEVRLDMAAHFEAVIDRANAGLKGLPNTLQMDHANLSMRISKWQGRIATSTNQLWPCISPFGLKSVLDAVLRTRASLRLRSRLVRKMLCAYQPLLAALPLDRGYPALPLTWKTFHRFLPIIPHFARRVAAKANRSFPIVSGNVEGDGLHLRLWDEEAVPEMLDPSRMRVAQLLDRNSLADFLGQSMAQGFPYEGQWLRLLGLEYALRRVESARKEAFRREVCNR